MRTHTAGSTLWDRMLLLGSVLLGLGVPPAIHGCDPGRVGPCAGDGCPHVPGCETSVTCDPDHVCVEQVCEGVAWICGLGQQGTYVWLRSAAPCDDLNSCTINDLCLEGVCRGTQMSCKLSPGNTCLDQTTLRSFDTTGFCQDGRCIYGSSDIKCLNGCVLGKCLGELCTGVTCDSPPGPCYENTGTCDDLTGSCDYPTRPVGQSCTSSDPCITSATCDANQQCNGTALDCTRPHTSGGTCVGGVCQGFKCDSGYSDCNTSWDDGCETGTQSDITNCGGCNKTCGAVAHATPVCTAGTCVPKCTSPHADCDKTYSNGCEIPIGVANTCNRSGLASFSGTTPPCGTAHCGKHATDDYHQDFGTWYCTFCSHCYIFSNGGSWCLYKSPSKGNFSSDRCPSCCNTTSYPAVCK